MWLGLNVQNVGDFGKSKKAIKCRNRACKWKKYKLMDFSVLLKCKRTPSKQLDNDYLEPITKRDNNYLEPITKRRVKKQIAKAPHTDFFESLSA